MAKRTYLQGRLDAIDLFDEKLREMIKRLSEYKKNSIIKHSKSRKLNIKN